MIQTHKLNPDKSREVFESTDGIENKECYINVFHVVTNHMDKFRSGEWEIAYGYWSSIRNMWARHCFIVDESGDVIDPTVYTLVYTPVEEALAKKYMSFITLNVKDYLSLLRENDNYPDLINVLMDVELKSEEWARDNGIRLMR